MPANAINRNGKAYTTRSPQEIQNLSFDELYQVETAAMLGYRADIDSFVPLNINKDGSLRLPGLLPTSFDDVVFSNPDVNGNYQTIAIKSSGTTVNTLTLTFDGSSNITRVTRT